MPECTCTIKSQRIFWIISSIRHILPLLDGNLSFCFGSKSHGLGSQFQAPSACCERFFSLFPPLNGSQPFAPTLIHVLSYPLPLYLRLMSRFNCPICSHTGSAGTSHFARLFAHFLNAFQTHYTISCLTSFDKN